MTHQAVLGLGGNLGDRLGNLSAAVNAIAALPGTCVSAVSGVYLTEAYGVPDEQPDYYNIALHISTELSARALLGACLGIEAALGRVRLGFKSARVIDIDLLLYEGEISSDTELILPHPRMLERAFVLAPLSELFPTGTALGLDFAQSLEHCRDQRIELTDNTISI